MISRLNSTVIAILTYTILLQGCNQEENISKTQPKDTTTQRHYYSTGTYTERQWTRNTHTECHENQRSNRKAITSNYRSYRFRY